MSKNIEVIFAEPRPYLQVQSKDTNFLQLLAEILNSLNILENEIFALGEMNTNILQNEKKT